MEKRKGLPQWGELVTCTVARITPFAAWCTLDEYETEEGAPVEGMIHISEVAGKWVKDIRKFVKPDKKYVAKVVKIDYEKGHINLSLKRVTKFDEKEKIETARRDKRAEGILIQVEKRLGETRENTEKEIVEKLAATDKYDDLLSAFEDAAKDKNALTEAGVSKRWIDALAEILERNFKEKEIKIKAMVELTTLAEDGVEKIKKALSELENKTGAHVGYISAPKYMVELKTKQPKESERKLREVLEEVIKEIENADGKGEYEFVKS